MTIERIKQAWMQSSMIKDKKHYKILKHIIISKKKWLKKQLSIELLNVISTHQQIAIFSNTRKRFEQRQRKDEHRS